MYRKILFLIPLLIAFSCEKRGFAEMNEKDIIDNTEVNMQSDSVALSEFAQLLSRAINKEEALRKFIKKEALKQYDNDYDVFYPWAKDKDISEGLTFEQILEKYDDDHVLHSCVKSVPKITILVPDWAWLDAFSIKSWNTSENDVMVGYTQRGTSHRLFLNGTPITLDTGEFPEQPTIIVKNNERMVVMDMTKGASPEFDYACQEFNGIMTKGRAWNEDEIDLKAKITTNFVPTKDIDPMFLASYDKYISESISEACQRDYIYYGMCKENADSGILNTNIRERFYRFKIEPGTYEDLSDSDEDPTLHDQITVKGRKNQLSESKLRELIWSGGNFEFKFDFYAGSSSSKTDPENSYVFSIKGDELFDLSKVHREYKKQTTVAKGVYKYSFKKEDLISKWYYPIGYQYAPEWDIFEKSNSLLICVTEIDPSEEVTVTEDWSYKKSKNFKWNVDVAGEAAIKKIFEVKLSFGLGGNKSKEETKNTKIVRKYTKTSDDLGKVTLPFEAKVIESSGQEQIDGNLVNGYYVRPVTFGQVSITFLPMDIR